LELDGKVDELKAKIKEDAETQFASRPKLLADVTGFLDRKHQI
jgi:hypothetical protein